MAPVETPERRFLGRLVQASRASRTCFDAELRGLGLTLSRGRLLLHLLASRHQVLQAELADVLEVEHPTVVRLLDSLEQLGHIERGPVQGDRRAKAIMLTNDGRRMAERVLERSTILSGTVLADVDPAELAIAERVLTQLSDNLAAEIALLSERRAS